MHQKREDRLRRELLSSGTARVALRGTDWNKDLRGAAVASQHGF